MARPGRQMYMPAKLGSWKGTAKLIGYIEVGFKCDSEVTLRAGGFDVETCAVSGQAVCPIGR